MIIQLLWPATTATFLCKGKVLPVHILTAHTHFTHYLGTRRPGPFTSGKKPQHPMNKKPQSQFGLSQGEKNLLPLARMKPHTVQSIAQSLYWLHCPGFLYVCLKSKCFLFLSYAAYNRCTCMSAALLHHFYCRTLKLLLHSSLPLLV